MSRPVIEFIDNNLAAKKDGAYRIEEVQVGKVLESWKFSLFSFEWLTPDGEIRDVDSLPELEQEKYQNIMLKLSRQAPLERPVLGIGMMDNIEIGSRRDVFLTLAKQGYNKIPVHVPVSLLKEFTPYL
ncbi:MAG: hypothetical protein HRT94_01435 [Alphaproteobacteria bacterium]|nr:hypothetical protein [Alphaproteobacteria bacterium]